MKKTRRSSDPFRMHRAALYPWRRENDESDLQAVLISDIEGFCNFLVENGLAPLWSDYLQSRETADTPPLPPLLRDAVRQARIASAAQYLLQTKTLLTATAALEAANVVHAAFKGAALRERLYADPALRSMDDLDILVLFRQRDSALKALTGSGMTLDIDAQNLSHEVALFDGGVHVDLHWRLFRPGRSRYELADALLERRERVNGLWMLDDTANLVVMLVHPAFAKHVCGPAAKLVRLVELDRLLETGQLDWAWALDT